MSRARQNVVFELGYFIARLGSDRVAALVSGDIELPSDYIGLVYIPYDNHEAGSSSWRATSPERDCRLTHIGFSDSQRAPRRLRHRPRAIRVSPMVEEARSSQRRACVLQSGQSRTMVAAAQAIASAGSRRP